MINTHNNFLPTDFANDLENMLLANELPWYLEDKTVGHYDQKYFRTDDFTTESYFLGHGFFKNGAPNSYWFEYFNNVATCFIHNLNQYEYTLERLKANLYMRDSGYPENHHHMAHRDSEKGCITALYYINDSDGDTFFFDESMNVVRRITPKKNTLVVFPSDMLHASSTPKITPVRFSLNMVFRKR